MSSVASMRRRTGSRAKPAGTATATVTTNNRDTTPKRKRPTAAVRSLSMPEKIHELAGEIRQLEEEVMARVAKGGGGGGNTDSLMQEKKAMISRRRSMLDAAVAASADGTGDDDEAVLLRILREREGIETAASGASTANSYHRRPTAAENRDDGDYSRSGSAATGRRRTFLPTYGSESSFEDSQVLDDSIGLHWGLEDCDQGLLLEDDDDDEEQDLPSASTKLIASGRQQVPEEQVRAAEACVNELLSVFGSADDTARVPMSKLAAPESTTNMVSALVSSPVSVTSTSLLQQPSGDVAASSCGDNSGRNDTVGTPSVTSSAAASDINFSKLVSGDRANSMPLYSAPNGLNALPRKPSLKRVSSFASSNSGSGRQQQTRQRVSSSNSLKRNVSFTKLEIREYSIALSDHPSCSYGPPIQLGWEYCDRKAVELDEYERQRSPRRNMDQMVLSYNVRRYLLLKRAGYSKKELLEAMKEVDRVKRDRTVTDMLLPVSKIDEALEEAMTNLKGIFFPPRQPRQVESRL